SLIVPRVRSSGDDEPAPPTTWSVTFAMGPDPEIGTVLKIDTISLPGGDSFHTIVAPEVSGVVCTLTASSTAGLNCSVMSNPRPMPGVATIGATRSLPETAEASSGTESVTDAGGVPATHPLDGLHDSTPLHALPSSHVSGVPAMQPVPASH